MTFSSKATVVGAAAFQLAGAAAKGAGMMGLFGAILSPLLVIFGNYASYRMSVDEAHTDEERGRIKNGFLGSLLITLVLSAVGAVHMYWACRNQPDAGLFWGLFFGQAIAIYFFTMLAMVLGTLPQRRRYLAGILSLEYAGERPEAAYEYRSRWSLFGLPLVHVRVGDRFDVVRGPVKAWIAIGSSHAVGVIFASGGVAVAPISFGGVAIGLVCRSGPLQQDFFQLGHAVLASGRTGGWRLTGGAHCGGGVAWNAAMGGLVFAHDFASSVALRARLAGQHRDCQTVYPTKHVFPGLTNDRQPSGGFLR